MSLLNIFTEKEQIEFDSPPVLSVEARSASFSMEIAVDRTLSSLHSKTNKVGFLIQYAYFKACRNFFLVTRFNSLDIKYAARLLKFPLPSIQLKNYKERTALNHRRMILSLFHCKSYQTEKEWVEKEIKNKITQVLEPRVLFLEILDKLHQNKIEIPNYYTLAGLITEHYISYEDTMLSIIKSELSEEQKDILRSILISKVDLGDSIFKQYKYTDQSLKPKAIQASITLFESINTKIQPLMPLITKLELSTQACEYYATWTKKVKLSQLKQFSDDNKLFLRLISFLQHQYILRHDNFIDIIIRSVQSSTNTIIKQLQKSESLSRTECKNAIKHITNSNNNHRVLISEIKETARSEVLTDSGKIKRITNLLNYHTESERKKETKTILYEQTLDNMIKDKEYFNLLEKQSRKLQNRVSLILQSLTFNKVSSNKSLLIAIEYFKITKGKLGGKPPVDFLDSDEQTSLLKSDGKFRTSLYKSLLFIHVQKSLKSGELNLKHSYRYLAIQDYLIKNKHWREDRDELMKLSRLEQFSDYKTVISKLKKNLNDKYHVVNQRMVKGLNPHISINKMKNNRIHVNTPAIDKIETRHIESFLSQVGYKPIFQILSDVDHITKLSDSFSHYNIKNSKLKPKKSMFYASIIGLGCNIGISKMAKISSGINQSTISNTVKWYFNNCNLDSANERIRSFINRLSLPHVFSHNKDEYHGSSDGRKVGVSVECLLATYSFKYFGKDKGVSVYTFIDDRNVLFHHKVISSSEREAAYVIDGLNNSNVNKIDIHSTDSHGYTELIFAATHLIETTFSPRLKNIGKQNIYSFKSKKTYQNLGYKILPSRTINEKLIENNWDQILRFMATIKLNKTSASQLFKRLSSYSKDNQLYRALKEFGRIIKSIFVLTFFDDVKLRQRIEKQLNRIESSNKFSKAVFYANNGELNSLTPLSKMWQLHAK